MQQLLHAIIQKHRADGIEVHPPANPSEMAAFEKGMGFALPDDFKEFYLTCNGFGCVESIFNMTPLAGIRETRRIMEITGFIFRGI